MSYKEYEVRIDDKMHKYGEVNLDTKVIRLNPKKGDFLNTVIHERLHANSPDMSEAQVQKESRRIERNMSVGDMAAMLKEVDDQTRGFAPTMRTTVTKVIHSDYKDKT